MRRLFVVLIAAFAVAASTALASPPHARVAVRTTSLGRVLVDSRGHTLYAFDRDKGGRSACSGACSSTWPPFLTSSTPVALKGVKASLLGTMRRSDGKLQVTFAHHPLYFFVQDTKAGEVGGVSIPHWSALSAVGKLVRAKPSAGDTSTTPYNPPSYGGGDGY